MRVIAGSARSIPLISPPGLDTRPTTDRIKETLFNMLQFSLPQSTFWDLFAGSGAMGIEAVSRGAAYAVLVDSSRAAADCIAKNIKKCRFEERTRLLQTDAASAVARLSGEGAKAERLIVFMDPPYGKGLEFPVLRALSEYGVLNGESLVIVETSLSGDLSEALLYGYEIVKEKKYKNQKHVFLKKK